MEKMYKVELNEVQIKVFEEAYDIAARFGSTKPFLHAGLDKLLSQLPEWPNNIEMWIHLVPMADFISKEAVLSKGCVKLDNTDSILTNLFNGEPIPEFYLRNFQLMLEAYFRAGLLQFDYAIEMFLHSVGKHIPDRSIYDRLDIQLRALLVTVDYEKYYPFYVRPNSSLGIHGTNENAKIACDMRDAIRYCISWANDDGTEKFRGVNFDTPSIYSKQPIPKVTCLT